MGLPDPPPQSLNLRPGAPTSLQKSLRQFSVARNLLPEPCGMRPVQAWGPSWGLLTPRTSQAQPRWHSCSCPQPTQEEDAPGSAWVGLAPPPPGMPVQRRAIPPTQPNPGRPGEQSGGSYRESQAPEGLMREDGTGARGGRKEQRDEGARGSRKKS